MPLAAFPKCYLDQLCVTHEMRPAEWIEMAAELDAWLESALAARIEEESTENMSPAELERLRSLGYIQ